MVKKPLPERRLAALVPAETYEQVEQLAKENERSVAAEVRVAVARHLEKAA